LGKFRGVLLVSDFDDTIYTADCVLPPENVRAVDYFVREGGLFTIATGRAFSTMAPNVGLLPINAPVVLSNGSALYDFQKNRLIHETFLPERVRQDVMEVARAFSAVGFEAYHGGTIYAHNPNCVTEMHIRRAKASYVRSPIQEIPLPWSKVIFQQENSLLREVQAYMLRHWQTHYEVIFSNEVMLELTCKGSTKGGMVRYLADLLGVEHAHIYCVGDNQNDLPMLKISAVPFAPENCAPEVRAWGARIVRPCGEGCMTDVIEYLDSVY